MRANRARPSLRDGRDGNHGRVAPATRQQEDTGVSILSRTEIAAYRTDGVVVPEFRLPPDTLAHLQSLAARLIADNPHMGDEPVHDSRLEPQSHRRTPDRLRAPNASCPGRTSTGSRASTTTTPRKSATGPLPKVLAPGHDPVSGCRDMRGLHRNHVQPRNVARSVN